MSDRGLHAVICAFTFKHVCDLPRAIGKLRQVTKRRPIMVISKQRREKRTFDLHPHFFSYQHNLPAAFRSGQRTASLGPEFNRWYIEEVT